MKRIILLFIICLCLFVTTSCNKDITEPTIVTPDTSEYAQQCANALIESIQPDRYAWCYDELQGKLNLTVDYICKVQIYYSKNTTTYFAEYICYVIGDDVDWEKVSSSRI